ncbi:MAG: hypothetical protein IKJ62_01045 [Alphaproteobacteria bacterium]|nr:hypothetical protein [Alphaproteobacteria bacterium]
MKKVLSAFFAVFLSMTGGYCENTSYVDTNLSSYDSMNSVISIRAIYESLNTNKCTFIGYGVKDEIAEYIAETISEGANITLEYFFSLCTAVHKHKITLSDKDIPGYVENCIGCTINIAEKHNELISKHEREQINNINNIDIFTSEEEYNKVLKAKGICTAKNSRWKLEFNRRVHTRRGCEKTCKDYAIANACLLDGIVFDGTCECCTEKLSMSMDGYFTPYYVRPTWEDYKKLYNIK